MFRTLFGVVCRRALVRSHVGAPARLSWPQVGAGCTCVRGPCTPPGCTCVRGLCAPPGFVRREHVRALFERSVALCKRALVRSHVRAPARLPSPQVPGEEHVCRGCAPVCAPLCGAGCGSARTLARTCALALFTCLFERRTQTWVGVQGHVRSHAHACTVRHACACVPGGSSCTILVLWFWMVVDKRGRNLRSGNTLTVPAPKVLQPQCGHHL